MHWENWRALLDLQMMGCALITHLSQTPGFVIYSVPVIAAIEDFLCVRHYVVFLTYFFLKLPNYAFGNFGNLVNLVIKSLYSKVQI